MSDSRTFGRAAVLLSVLLAGGCVYPAYAQPQAPAALPAETPNAAPAAQPHSWPRVFQEGADTLTLYQPQIEKWDDTTITFRAAVAVESSGSAEPIYGMVRTTARADVDKAAGVVTLHDFQIEKVVFPTAPERAAWYAAILSRRLPAGAKEVSLDRLEASAAVSLAVKKQRGLGVNNDPPRIIFSTTPSLLVLVDGDPVLRPLGEAERVINTHALIVNAGGAFYLTALNFWYEAPQIAGPWSPVAQPTAFLAQLRQAAGDQVDLMQPEAGAAAPETPPAVYVSTVPAELIQTDGAPQFIPVPGTGLLQAQNSDDAVFLDPQALQYYVLISGRWFKSVSLQRGPWAFVSARELPADFARIPPDNPRANVLVSVPGTPEAQEALIANAIPQTATVTPGPAKVNLLYDGAADGAPQFEPVEGVPDLLYATNASLPVIAAGPGAYYCVQNGIWCVAPTPTGPWTVATAVPPAFYSIPPSCPDYYVTYCRIYGSTPQAVYVGYTPGYLGSVVSADGVVVYGTGYRYRPHIGRAWVPQPCSYGFGAGFACGSDTGFAFGFSEGIFPGARLAPYWGPYDWGWRHHFDYSQISVNHVDLYEHWSGKVVSIPERRGGEEENARLRPETRGGQEENAQPHPQRRGGAEENAQPHPQRRAGEEENAQPHPQAPFNPYSARTTTLAHGETIAPSPHEPAAGQKPPAKTAKLDWGPNAKPRSQTLAEEAATKAANRPAPASEPNNVFVSATGEVYRSTPASNIIIRVTGPANPGKPAPEPAAREEPVERRQATEPVPAPRETATPAHQPAQPTQWEQHTSSGWKPAAQSPTFQKVAPELNREAAARNVGETRAVSRPAPIEPRVSAPIVPSRPSPPPSPPPMRQSDDSTRGKR